MVGDAAAASYKRRPVTSLDERVAVIAGCRFVDEVVPECPIPVTDAFLDEHGVDLVVHGDDFDQASNEFWYGAAIRRGIFATVPYTRTVGPDAVSTTAIIERVRRASP